MRDTDARGAGQDRENNRGEGYISPEPEALREWQTCNRDCSRT